jgi:hypothetical protein
MTDPAPGRVPPGSVTMMRIMDPPVEVCFPLNQGCQRSRTRVTLHGDFFAAEDSR